MNRKMLDILACPADKHSPLELHECAEKGGEVEEGALYCAKCGRFYAIMEGIPIMMPDELRDKDAELGLLKRHSKSLPESVLNGLPWGS